MEFGTYLRFFPGHKYLNRFRPAMYPKIPCILVIKLNQSYLNRPEFKKKNDEDPNKKNFNYLAVSKF